MIAAATIAAACAWTDPGADPYRGTVAAAIAAYDDIPLRHRAGLWVQHAMGIPHAVITITRDGIEGGPYSNLRDMHWGGGAGARLCRGPVSRAGWAPGHTEVGFVYCSGTHGLVITPVCNNVSRIDCGDLPDPEPERVTRPDPREEWRPPNRQPDRPNEVPEPWTLALVLLAAGIGAAVRKSRPVGLE